jgi:hypothetical protein
MLERAARAVCRLVHGNRRSRDGYLLIQGRYWMADDQEVRAGKSYLGLAGLPVFIANITYMVERYGHEEQGGRVASFSVSGLPLEEKILLPVSLIAFLIAVASIVRLFIVISEVNLQRRSDLGE